MVCVLVGKASVSQNLRLIFDCIFVTLAINALRNAVSHTHLLNLSVVNWFYLYVLFVLIFAKVLALTHFIPITKCIDLRFSYIADDA